MAGLQFSSGISNGFENDLTRMNTRMNSFSGSVQKKGTLINNTFKQIGTTIGGLASVAVLAQAGKKVVSFSADLQTALTEVSTISGEVTDNFDKYKQSLLSLSTQSSSSAIELTNAFYDVVSAGYDGAKGIELLTAAEKASTAGFVEVGTAADGLTTVLNAWGKSADEAGQVSDVFFKTVEKGKTTFPELASNISQVAPLASSLGVSFEEVSAAAATITKSGVPTAQAFTQIRSALVGMNSELGDGWAETMTLQEGFQEISDRADGSSTKIQELVGRVEGMNAVLALTGKNAEVAAADLDAMNNSLNATEIAAQKVATTAANQAKILVNNILVAFEPLGTSVVETFADLATSLNNAFNEGDIEKYTKVLGILIKAFVAWKISVFAIGQAQKVNTALTTLNSAAQKTAAITGKSVTAGNYLMAKSFKSLKAAFASNPIGLLVTGLTLAIPLIIEFTSQQNRSADAINEFTKNTREAKEGLDDAFGKLEEAKKGTKEYETAIISINSKYGDYIDNLDAQTSSVDDIKDAYDDALISLKAFNLEQAKQSFLGDDLANVASAQSRLISSATSASDLLSTSEQKGRFQNYINQLIESVKDGNSVTTENLENAFRAAQSDNTFASVEEYLQAFRDGSESFNKGLVETAGVLGGSNVSVLQSSIKELSVYSQNLKLAQSDYEAFTAGFLGSDTETAKIDTTQVDAVEKVTELTKDELAKQRKDAINSLEIANQEQINVITDDYGNREELEDQFNSKMIAQRIEYLTKLKTLTVSELDKLKIDEELINLKASETTKSNNNDEINDLLKQYQTYAQKRESLIKEANTKVASLQLVEGSAGAISEIEKELESELSKLDLSNIESTTSIDKLFESTKNKSLAEVQNLVDGARTLLKSLDDGQFSDNIFGIDESTFELLQEQPELIAKIKEAINTMNDGYDGDKNFGETISLLTDMNTLTGEFIDNLGDADDSTSILAKGVLSASANFLGLVQSVKAVGTAVTALETASAILAAISAALKVVNAINDAINSQEEERISNYVSELAAIEAINLELIETIALYEEGNSFFSDDTWGTALSGLEAYNEALEYQNTLLDTISTTQGQDIDEFGVLQYFNAATTLLGSSRVSGEESQLSDIKAQAQTYATELEQALASVAVKTTDKSGLANFFGAEDQYESLLEIYPDLIDANGDLDTAILQTVIDTAKLGEVDQANLEALLEATEAAEEAYDAFGDYISDIFSSVGDDVASAFQEMYESGTDAMESLEDSFAEMIESFTNDAIEYAFLQPLIDELNTTTQALGVDYASGDISVDELSSSIISTLGSFYDSLSDVQPSILQAYEDADALASAAGFDSAFEDDDDDDDTTTDTSGDVSDSITEETGSIISGRAAAIMISNQIIADNSSDMLDYAVQNLVTLNKIKINTDYLPMIAEYTRKTAEGLTGI